MQTRLQFLFFLLIFTNLNAQGDYPGNSQLESRIKALTTRSRFISIQSIGKSVGSKELWVLKFSKPESGIKPAILIVAGADGKHAAGTEITLLPYSEFKNKPIQQFPGGMFFLKHSRSGSALVRGGCSDFQF